MDVIETLYERDNIRIIKIKEKNKYFVLKFHLDKEDSIREEYQMLQRLKNLSQVIHPICFTEITDQDFPQLNESIYGIKLPYFKYTFRNLVEIGFFLDKNQGTYKETFKRLLTILSSVHKRNVVYIDMKPSNVCFSDYSNISKSLCLIDFGNSIDKNEIIVGRVSTYPSPEEFMRIQHLTSKSDVYSLANTMIYLLTQRFIFEYHVNPEKLDENNFNFKALQERKDYKKKLDKLNIRPPELKNLLENMLKFSHLERFSIEDCLNHSYFSEKIRKEFSKKKLQRLARRHKITIEGKSKSDLCTEINDLRSCN